MCGIIGYTGSENVKDVLLDALELLEYRGYDSAGIAVKDETSHVTNVYKCAGRVSDLREEDFVCLRYRTYKMGNSRWSYRPECTSASAGESDSGS